MSDGGKLELRVGIFVTAALLVGGAFVFVIGNRSAMFQSKRHYKAVFDEVSGLRAGSPVRISGIDVGTIDRVEFDESGRCVAHLSVRQDMARFVRRGSRAALGSKGLLGDQLVNITVGPPGPQLREWAYIPTHSPSLLQSFLGETGDDAQVLVRQVRQGTAFLADPAFQRDVRTIAHNLAELSRNLNQDGTVRRLMTDPQLADRVENTLGGIETTSRELARTTRSVRMIADEVRRGDGTAHEVIYGRSGIRLLGSLAMASGELATILRDVRTGDGNAHQLLYGDDAGTLINNLTQASADIRAIMRDVRRGRGTIGGLLTDPSIYEDIKRLVGNLQRNEILRSLVRYSIRQDEQARPARVRPRPRPAPSTSSSE